MFYEAKCKCGCIYATNDAIKRLSDAKCFNCGEELRYALNQVNNYTDKLRVKTAKEKTILNFKLRELKF